MKPFKVYCLLLLMITACTTSERAANPEDWTDEEVNDWFEGRDWLGETDMRPDTTIDEREFAIRYHENKQRWDTAFAFIRKGNFLSLPSLFFFRVRVIVLE